MRLFALTAALLLASPLAHAFFELGGPLTSPSKQKNTFRYTGAIQRRIEQQSLVGGVPVYRGDKDGVGISAKASWLNLFPDESKVPDVYDLQLGTTYTHEIEEKRLWSATATFGSASDKPFKSFDVCTIGATVAYAFPESDISSWTLFLNYSNNRPFLNNMPLPGFAYHYTPSKQFRGVFGIPFAMISWEFVPRWTLSLMTIAPWVAKAQVAYSIVGPIQAFIGIDFAQSTYFLYGRENRKERLFYDEKKAFLGIRSPLSRELFAELETGVSFGRQFFTAEKFSRGHESIVPLGTSMYGKVALSAAF